MSMRQDRHPVGLVPIVGVWKSPNQLANTDAILVHLRAGSVPDFTHSTIAKEIIMGILEEAAGAFAAVEATKKLDPNAGIITEGVAAVAGFEGTEAITNFIEKKEEEKSGNQS
jgi:hypothetical protein